MTPGQSDVMSEKAKALAIWEEVDGLNSFIEVLWEGEADAYYTVKVPTLGLTNEHIESIMLAARRHGGYVTIEGPYMVIR